MRLMMIVGAGLFALLVAVGLYFTRRTARDPNNATFALGNVPDPLPNGTHRGVVPGYERLARRWKGKRFDAATSSGTNLVLAGDRLLKEAFPFRTYLAREPHVAEHDVLRVDYNTPENPFWLRVCADDLVQVGPGHYLGKSYIRLLPGRPFTMLFFELRAGEAEPTGGQSEGVAAKG